MGNNLYFHNHKSGENKVGDFNLKDVNKAAPLMEIIEFH